MSQNVFPEKYGPVIRVPPLLVMDAILSGRLVLLNSDGFPVLSFVIHLAVLLICAVLFFLPVPTLSYCYTLMVTMAALQASYWWNAIFLQKMGVNNLTAYPYNQTTVSPFEDGDQVNAFQIVLSDEFLLYLCIQMLYSFVFTKVHALVDVPKRQDLSPVITVWIFFISPVLLHLFLRTIPLLSPHLVDDVVQALYFIYPIAPILLHENVSWTLFAFGFWYLSNAKFLVQVYLRIYTQLGLQILVENQWIRLKVPTVLRLFWLVRFGLHVGQIILNDQYAAQEAHESIHLSTALFDIAVHSCSTMIAVLGFSAMISPIANGVGNLARLFIGGERDGGENIGTVSAVLFFILAIQTGLPDLSPANRVVRLARNLSLLSTAILHFVHTMLHSVMMQLSTAHIINRNRHARALLMAAVLIVLPVWFIVHLWLTAPMGTWMLALSAFCLELIVKVLVTLVVYTLFFIDTQSDKFWEGLDDYVYYVKAVGSTIEFMSGIFLFMNGAWIFVFESRGVIRAFMICIHAYFNIFQLGKDGWKKFQNRRLAVQKIQSLEQATPEFLSRHNDVCPICYQELNNACITPCGHLFHAMCLRKWLYMQDSCPLCHKEIMMNNGHADEGQAEGAEEAEVDQHHDD